ncbi:MAG TPA: hypothetical protein VEB65_11590 [Solirubrobacterales bacterium]|nr:hypothetical protein [Solirubrobacterales bacterium]
MVGVDPIALEYDRVLVSHPGDLDKVVLLGVGLLARRLWRVQIQLLQQLGGETGALVEDRLQEVERPYSRSVA